MTTLDTKVNFKRLDAYRYTVYYIAPLEDCASDSFPDEEERILHSFGPFARDVLEG